MSWTPTSTAGATNTIIANVSSRLCDWLSTSKRATSSRHLAECPLPYLPACLPASACLTRQPPPARTHHTDTLTHCQPTLTLTLTGQAIRASGSDHRKQPYPPPSGPPVFWRAQLQLPATRDKQARKKGIDSLPYCSQSIAIPPRRFISPTGPSISSLRCEKRSPRHFDPPPDAAHRIAVVIPYPPLPALF